MKGFERALQKACPCRRASLDGDVRARIEARCSSGTHELEMVCYEYFE